MIPTWEERQQLLGFNEQDVQKLTIVQSAYSSPYSQMAKRLFSEVYGLQLVEVEFEVPPEKIGLIDSTGQPVLNSKQQVCYDAARTRLEKSSPDVSFSAHGILQEALEETEFELTAEQYRLLALEKEHLEEQASIKMQQADMVFLAGNASDVPPAFYKKTPHKKTKIRHSPLYIRPEIDRSVVMVAGKKDLPMWGVCYGAQMMVVNGFGDEDRKGAWLIQDIPDHGCRIKKDTHTHIKPKYGGVTRKVTADFVDNGEYISALRGEADNPFIHSDAVQPIEIVPGTSLHALARSAFPEMCYRAEQTIEFAEYHSHHQAVKWDTIDPAEGLYIAAWSKERFVEATEAGRDADSNKVATLMIGTQVHPEVGIGMPAEWLEDVREGKKEAPTGNLLKSFAEAMIYTSLFLDKWQKAGFARKDAPTYAELVRFEEQLMSLPSEQRVKIQNNGQPMIVYYVAKELKLCPQKASSINPTHHRKYNP